MALVTCKDCKKEFSNDAKRCPHCGARKPGRIGFFRSIIIIVVFLWVLGKILDIGGHTIPLPGPTQNASTAPNNFRQQMAETGACNSTAEQQKAAGRLIRAFGYDCQTVDAVCPYAFSEGFTVHCNDGRYQFELENHGGKWSVRSE